MGNLVRDLRVSIRTLFRTPGFACVAVLTMALGIGATSAVFTLVKAVLVDPLPFAEPERLVQLWGNVQREVVERRGTSFPDFEDWRDRSRSFEVVAAQWGGNFVLQGVEHPERIAGEAVSSSYFALMGVQPLLGRVFDAGEDRVGAPRVAVIGETLWRRLLGASPSIAGSSLRVDDQAYTVIGVLPKQFRGLGGSAEFWVAAAGNAGEAARQRGARWFAPVARLKQGVPIEQARSEMTGIARALEQVFPETNEKRGVEVVPLQAELAGDLKPALLGIMGAVSVLLLVAVVNVAGLFLARCQARSSEIAVRVALGAGRGPLLRQSVAEALVLSVAGGLLGAGIAVWAVEGLVALSPVEIPAHANTGVDGWVLLFAVAVSAGCGIGLGMAPAWLVSFREVAGRLKEGATRSSGSRAAGRSQSALVVVQMSMALVLLVAAGVLAKSLERLIRVDAGFETEGVLSMRLSAPQAAPGSSAAPVARRIRETLRALPGVEDVSLSSDLPLSGEGGAIFYTAEGQPAVDARNRPRAYTHRVTEGFFRTLGIHFVSGRDFQPEEMSGERNVVIVTENLTRRFWPGREAVGKRIRAGGEQSRSEWMEIIGVVSELKYRALPKNPTADPDIFLPFRDQARNFAVLVRAAGRGEGLGGVAERKLRETEPGAVVFNSATLDERAAALRGRARLMSWLTAVFAGSALGLVLLGLFAVLSRHVSRRAKEIGIRAALGAAGRDIAGLVLAHTLRLAAAGLVLGALGAWGVSRWMNTLLFEVNPLDPGVLTGAGVLLTATALAAAWLPARRAARLDPMIVLRQE